MRPEHPRYAKWFACGLLGFLSVAPLVSLILGGNKNRTGDFLEQRLQREFNNTNPSSLAGWKFAPPSPGQRTATWSKGGIVYSDYNADGLPDLKCRESYLSTIQVFWTDSDYDGMFDTEITQDCFHRSLRPLDELVAVPAPSVETAPMP